MTWKYFKQSEFDDPTEPGSGSRMDPALIDTLDEIRALVGFPMLITSGFRTAAHNAAVGGTLHSSHTTGHAADIAVKDGRQRYLLVRTALALGINRIGIKRDCIHLDNSPDLPQDVIWTYD